MLEEELEKYINAAFCREKTGIEEITIEDLKQAFQDGYDTANEWHYPSKEELPEEMKDVLFYGIDGKFYIGILGDHNKGWFINVPFLGGALPCSKPIAWRYIEPPKEEE